MPYTNTIVTTSTGGTWDSVNGLLYSSISLIDGIPHSAQLEVERVFTTPRDTTNYSTIEDFLNNPATTQKDKQQVFVIPASRITFDETNKKITAINLPSTGDTYDYDPDGVALNNVPVPAIVSGTSVLKVRRKTVSNETLVTWSAGSKLTSAQLNLETKQLIYLIQELIDKTTTEVNVSNTTIGTVTNYSITPIKLSAGGPTWTSGGALTSLSIQNTPIGSTTRSTGAFTTLASNGATTMTAGTASSSTTTGTLVITGGAGVSGTVYAGGFNGPLTGNVTGNITGNVTGNLTGSVLTASQTNITSLGTLSSLAVTGQISGGSIQSTPIGSTTRSTGAFTTLTANNAVTMTAGTSSSAYTSGTLVVTGGVGISENLNVQLAASATSLKINGAVSADPNTIDKYEEQQILLASSDFGGDTTLGNYTINTTSNPSFICITTIGDRIMIDGIVTLTAITTAGTGPIRISNANLPDIGHGLGWLTCYFANLATGAAINLVGYWTGKKIYFYLTKAAAASMTALVPADLSATTQIRFCGCVRR
jgi:hypothetical protein